VSFHFAKPSWPLSLFVKQYWALENCQPAGEEHIQRIVPSGLTELTFYFDGRPKSLDAQKDLEDNTILCGHLKGFYDISVTGNLSMFSVSFTPFGLRMFLGMPACEFYDSNVPFRYVVSELSDRLEDTLFEAPTFEEKVAITERFLKGLLSVQTDTYEIKRISNSLQLIRGSKGLIPVDTLSDAACVSRKQFERIFLNYIGTSPKQFLKTIRFQASLHLKHYNPDISLTELAYSCGYFDQAHMINDFKTLSGITPGQYFKECEPVSDFFTE